MSYNVGNMRKPIILTGLRANNDLHIGNYFGALLPLVDIAKKKAGEHQINLFVPDLHSFTTAIDHAGLQTAIKQNLRTFVAAGLPIDHDDVFIYRQSYIPAHSELTWILDCFTGMGEMSRMTQFKDRSTALGEDRISLGLYNYPVLMAADILLYGAEYVPVGEDQTQHLEYTRDIAVRLNNKFGELFVVPKTVKQQHEFFGKDQGLRIRNLQNPTKKMSKSDQSNSGVVFLTDTPDEARQKITAAETDGFGEIHYDYAKQPGISNLLEIFGLLGGNKDEFIGQNQYGPFKTAVADKVAEFLVGFRKKFDAVSDEEIEHKLEASEMLMHEVSLQRLHKVQQAVGLRPR